MEEEESISTKCLFCTFSSSNKTSLLKHQLSHQHDPTFRVVCSLCTSKFKSVKALQKHLVSLHKKKLSMTKQHIEEPTVSTVADDADTDSEVEIDQDMSFYFNEVADSSLDASLEDNAPLPEEILQQKAHAFLSNIRDKCVSPQTSIDQIVKGMEDLMVHYNLVLETKLLACQTQDIITASEVKSVFENLRGQSLFEGLQTRQRQIAFRKYYLTSLEPILISTKNEPKLLDKSGFKVVPVVQGYASPFLQVLEVLLQCEDILHCIQNPLKSEDGKIRYLADGYMWQSHPVLVKDPCSIVIVAYGDDLGPGDGLSCKGSHLQLRSFTWTIGNIYPWLRSTLKSINLLSLCTKIRMDQGNRPALKDFIAGINKLSTEGVVFNIKGKPTKFHGCLLFVCGDTPASANFAGMKESPSAFSPCRLCLVNKHNIFDHFVEDGSLLRNAELHENHLQEIYSGNAANDDSFTDSDEQDVEEDALSMNPSMRYGVNSRSCFMEVKYFDVTKAFPLDIMHVFAESGVLEVNARLLLKDAISSNRVKLSEVNDFISSFDYGPLKKDKPGQIKAEHLNNNLRQTASQMFLLAHLIPFILNGRCDPAKLKNYNRLLMILSISLASVADDEVVDVLRNIIKDFLREFKRLYGELMTLKWHFLTHLPTQILMFGVLTEQWCMRFEGFHAILKRLFKILHNAVNVPLSITGRVLDRFLNEVETSPPGKFLYAGHSGKMGPAIQFECLEWKNCLKSAMPQLHDDNELIPVENLTYHGFEFKVDCIVLLDVNAPRLPKFGTLFKIFLFQEIPILLCRDLETIQFDVKFNAYEVKCMPDKSMMTAMCLKETHFVRPLLGVSHQKTCYIPLMYESKVPYSALESWTLEDSANNMPKSKKRARR